MRTVEFSLAKNMDDSDEIYRTGLLDALNNRESLCDLLLIMGETELLLSYVQGRIMGDSLLRDAEIEV